MPKFPITSTVEFQNTMTSIAKLLVWAQASPYARDRWTAGLCPYETFDSGTPDGDGLKCNISLGLTSDPRTGPAIILHNDLPGLPEPDLILDTETVLEIINDDEDPLTAHARRLVEHGYGYTDGDGNTWRAVKLDEDDQLLHLVVIDSTLDSNIIGLHKTQPLHTILVGPQAEAIRWGRLSVNVIHQNSV